MDHGHIERLNLIEQYALGRLDEEESIRFEEHFADCLECQGHVEAAQDLAAGLADFSTATDAQGGQEAAMPEQTLSRQNTSADTAADKVLPFSTSRTSTARSRVEAPSQPRTWRPVAAAALLALLPSFWLMWQNAQLGEELRALRQPFASTPVLSFEATRNSTSQNSQPDVPEIDVSGSGPWIALGFALADVDAFELSARLEGPGGTELWRGQDLRRSPSGDFQIIVPRAILDPGVYTVRFAIQAPDGRTQSAGDYRFAVPPAPAPSR